MGSGSTAYTASYDAAGDMVCRAPSGATSCSGGVNTGQQLTWDTEGRLAAWQDAPTAPSTTASYLYDGEGQRVAQQVTSGGTTTTTTYVGSLAEYATTGGTTSRTDYLYAAGKLVAEAVTSGTPGTTTLTYLVTNAQGTPLEALDGSGTVTASRLYTPYGGSRYTSGAFPTSYGYTGQRTDATSGLDYYGARYYDPAIGQFTSADTVMAGLNRYGYVGGNPISRTDPSGHMGAEKERYGGSGGGRGGGLSLAFKVAAGLVVVGELAVIVMGMIIIADRSGLLVINPDGSYGERFSPGDPAYNTWSQAYNDALKDTDVWNARTAPKSGPKPGEPKSPVSEPAGSTPPTPQPGGGSTGGAPPGGGGGGVASPAHPEDDGCGCGDTVSVYRVQGGGSAERIRVDSSGNIRIVGHDMLHLNFGQWGHAEYFLDLRGAEAYIVTFQVLATFLEFLRSVAVRQRLAAEFPDSPQIDDPSKAPDLYGLRENLFDELLEHTVPSSGRIIRPGEDC